MGVRRLVPASCAAPLSVGARRRAAFFFVESGYTESPKLRRGRPWLRLQKGRVRCELQSVFPE
jgi:hypothetical protein